MKLKIYLAFIVMLSCILPCGCSSGNNRDAGTGTSGTRPQSSASSSSSVHAASAKPGEDAAEPAEARDPEPKVLVPSADGTAVYENEFAVIDASNLSQGYVMVKYLGTCGKVRFQAIGPDGATYSYLLGDSREYTTFPLSAGDGPYTLQVLENIGGTSYVIALSQDVEVKIADEFLPFLYPNQYVNFTPDSEAVALGSSLSEDASTDLDVVDSVYHYVIQNISYDTAKAQSVTTGYLPDIDETLSTKKGICFDYASLMAAMLRSQGIPTKLEVGYSGDAYHAWISTYVDDIGWIDNIIQFDGKSWELLDPTLAANNSSSSVGKYIGDGSNYTVKYSY